MNRNCSICGEAIKFEQVADLEVAIDCAEVVNKTTEAHSLVHVECYLADTDCYSLA